MREPKGLVSADADAQKRAEQALASCEERLRSLIESFPGLLMTLDREYRITSVDHLLPGFTPEQVLGASAFDFTPPDYIETARRAFELVFRTARPTSYETVATQGSESGPMWFLVYVGPLRSGDEVVGLTLITDDISARKRLEGELRAALARAESNAAELVSKNQMLAHENEERRRTEEDLRRQREVVARLSTPIIQAWEGVLALPIIGMLDSTRAAQMMERLLAEIASTRARFAVLDLTGVEAVDTATVGYIINIVRAASLLGSQCLVSGISPGIAQTMSALGTWAEEFRTFAQMQDALRYALAESGVRGSHPRH
jgi:PAS domain S-box-containing protein